MKADEWKAPMLVDASGRHDSNIFMVFDEDTEVYDSSSITWRNQFFVFGGTFKRRQISKLSGFKLTLVGTLAFDHSYAGCSTQPVDQLRNRSASLLKFHSQHIHIFLHELLALQVSFVLTIEMLFSFQTGS